MSIDPATWRARDIAASVAGGELSVGEVADTVLAQIDATEDLIHAFSQLDRDGVKAQAAALDEEVASGRLRGPLHGVPVAIKEWFDVEGFATLNKGADSPPEPHDSEVVARLRAAGALIVGKTAASMGDTSPPTCNPWNLGHTPGGSSSGSAAAVAARVVPLSIGEQTGGSTLRPAAFCGIAGMKPTYGVISRRGLYPGAWSRDHPGPMALDAQDMALCLSVIGGHDPNDRSTIEGPAPLADLDLAQLRAPRIGIVRNLFPELTGEVMSEAVETAAHRLRSAGADVVDVTLPDEYAFVWDAVEMQAVEGLTAKSKAWGSGPTTLAEIAAGTGGSTSPRATRGRVAEFIPATYYVQSLRIRNWIARMVIRHTEEHHLDALLMAATRDPAPAGLSSTGDLSMLIPWSFLGFPTLTINAGLSPDGLPTGLQLVSTPRTDHHLLQIAAWSEQTLGLLPPPPLSN